MADERPPARPRGDPDPSGIPAPALDALTRTLARCLRGEVEKKDVLDAVRAVAGAARARGTLPEQLAAALTRAYRAVPQVADAPDGAARNRLLVRVAALCIEAYYDGEREVTSGEDASPDEA